MAISWRLAWLGTVAFVALTAAGGARAADVNVTADDSTGINLDAETGSTVEIDPGVTVTNAPFSQPISATTSAWALTNRGSVNSSFANTISLSVAGSSVTNYSSIVAGSFSNAIWMTGGGSVDNMAGASISADQTGIRIGTAPAGMVPGFGPGTVVNAGTITQTGTAGDLVSLLFGGTVTNLSGATISANNGSNAVSVGQGASRTVINSGTITNTGTGFATGVLVQGGPSTVTNNEGGLISGTFNGVYASASGVLTFTNNGTIRSTGASASARAVEATGGGTFLNTGTIQSASSDGLYLARAGTVTNSGTITGATRAINFSGNYARTLNLDTGSVLNGLVQGGTGADSLVLLGTGTESAAKFLAFETLSMQGTAWQMDNAGTFTTSATVHAGALTVAGALTSPTISVQSAGTLTGNGTLIGAVTNSGTVRVSSGALAITGSFTSQAGSTFVVGVTPATGAQLAVTGAAVLNGGTVQVLAGSGTYAPSTAYTILTAGGGRTDTFSGVTSNFAFLDPSLTYDANNVYLTLERNGIDFASIGGTPNQRAAGSGVESLGFGNPVYEAVSMLDIDGARYAFDQLSGEVHASAHGMLIEDSRFPRDAVLDRLAAAFNGAGAALPIMAYADDEAATAQAATDGFAVWGQGFGSWGERDSDGNAASFDRDIGGLFIGADAEFAERWRVGVLGGYSRSSLGVADRASSGESDDYHLGLYTGAELGRVSFRAGAAYAWHDVETRRLAVAGGFSDELSADYDAGTAQVFGELGYEVDTGAIAFEPFAGLAYVNVRADGFTETGGAAVLAVSGHTSDTTFATLGVRASMDFALGSIKAVARGTLGWRHAFGDVTPLTTNAFAAGDSFVIAGTPIAEDAALVEVGLNIALSESAGFGLTYAGQFGDGMRDNGLFARLDIGF